MRYITLICLIVLTACATTQPQQKTPTTAITDPDDTTLRQSLMAYFEKTKNPVASAYVFHRTDLNNDGLRDAIILMRSPYGYWCDTHGCKMLIAKAKNNDFDIIQSIAPVREPVYLSDTTTNGWKDIVLHILGRIEKPKTVKLRFNGKTYPHNPDILFHEDNIDLKTLKKFFNREGT